MKKILYSQGCNALFMIRLLSFLFLFCFIGLSFVQNAGAIDVVKIKNGLNTNHQIAGIFKKSTNTTTTRLELGTEYIFAINTEGIDSIKNETYLRYGRYIDSEQKSRSITFRLDPSESSTAYISVTGTPDNLKTWEFTIQDCSQYDETGIFQMNLTYNKPGSPYTYYSYDYYTLNPDKSPDYARVLNDLAPVREISVKVGHLGSLRTDTEIQTMIENLKEKFLTATGGYGKLIVDYIGRHPLPDNNELVGEKVHNYLNWWNSLSHDLTNTDLLPLDPNDPDDYELIKAAWYSESENNNSQLEKDVMEIFGFGFPPGNIYVIFVELPVWASVGNKYAQVGYYFVY